MEALKEQRAPTLVMIDKHRSLIKDREDLAASSQDASRLMLKPQKGERRDPTRLLREEKMRKRIAKDLPKVEAELRKVLESWEDEYGRPFLVRGERYLDEIEALAPVTRAAPPRSKTPSNNAPQSAVRSTKAAPSASRNGTMRGPPPPRSKTPTASIARNPLASSVMGPPSAANSTMKASVSAHGGSMRSPSKIPSRMPLSNMPHGTNSPERKARPPVVGHVKEDLNSTIRGRMGPPPPKMKDIFSHAPPTPTPSCPSTMNSDRSGSIVRHTEPEDVYDDRSRGFPSYSTTSTMSRPNSVIQHQRPFQPQQARQQYPSAPPPVSRQISNTSSVATAQSGSENWETYTDASEEEPDARDAYYAKVRSAKRESPDDGYDGIVQSDMAKRLKGYGLGINNGDMVRADSETAWTTDDGSVF